MIVCLAPIEAFVGAPRRERLPKAGLASKKNNLVNLMRFLLSQE